MKKQTSIVFTGDIGFDRYMYGQWNDPELLSAEVLEFLHSADHVVANVEGPVYQCPTNTATSGAAQLLHTIDPAAVTVLNNMHADIWNICNNHIMDAGPDGLAGTLEHARLNGAKTLGAGMDIGQARKPVIIEEAGGIGMIGVGYQRACRAAGEEKPGCYSWSDLEAIRNSISDIKKTCRWCVVVAHAGEEFTALPSPYTRERFHLYLDMGADIVVCHHPHVPMNYETREKDGKVIFYSLGNFIFDTDYQRAQYNTDIGLLISVNFTETEFTYEPLGLKILRGPEHVVKGDIPRIFTDVQEDEYNLLAPLSARMFIEATKRQQTYLNPAEFKDAGEEKWREHFALPLRTGRVPGETLDFYIICPLAEQEKEKAWQRSKLEKVKEYILEQMHPLDK